MSRWNVEISPRARRDLKRLDPPIRRRMFEAIKGLEEEPPKGDVRKLTGMEEWRLRVGIWRVRFARNDEAGLVLILRVLPRGRAYRD